MIDDVIQADDQGKPSAAGELKLELEMVIQSAEGTCERMPKQIFYIPVVVLLALIWMLQRRRRSAGSAQPAAT